MADIDWSGLTGLAGNIATGVLNNSAANQASGTVNTGVNMANAGVGNALTAATNIASPYLQTAANLNPQYQQSVAYSGLSGEQMQPFYDAVTQRYSPYTSLGEQAAGQQMDAINALQNIGGVDSYMGTYANMFQPYTTAGAEAAGQQMSAVSDLRNLGSAMDYYNQVYPMYSQNIQAGQNMLNPAQNLANQVAQGYNYGDFENSGYYKALENANLQAQRQLAAQAGASGMTGSGTMAAALGNRMQENYANYYGQAAQNRLQEQQVAGQQFQALINQGLTAQQAANTVANQMYAGDVNRANSVLSALGNIAGQGITSQSQVGSLAQNERAQDITKAQAVVNALQTATGQGQSAVSGQEQNYLNWGNQQLASEQAQQNALYNSQQLGGTMGQQLMQNYLTGANIIGQNTLSGAGYNATTAKQSANANTQNLTSLLNNPTVQNLLAQGGSAAVNWLSNLVNSDTATVPTSYYSDYEDIPGGI